MDLEAAESPQTSIVLVRLNPFVKSSRHVSPCRCRACNAHVEGSESHSSSKDDQCGTYAAQCEGLHMPLASTGCMSPLTVAAALSNLSQCKWHKDDQLQELHWSSRMVDVQFSFFNYIMLQLLAIPSLRMPHDISRLFLLVLPLCITYFHGRSEAFS